MAKQLNYTDQRSSCFFDFVSLRQCFLNPKSCFRLLPGTLIPNGRKSKLKLESESTFSFFAAILLYIYAIFSFAQSAKCRSSDHNRMLGLRPDVRPGSCRISMDVNVYWMLSYEL